MIKGLAIGWNGSNTIFSNYFLRSVKANRPAMWPMVPRGQ